MPVNVTRTTTTPVSKSSSSSPVLKQGSKGASVVDLQKQLTKAGFKCSADGDFGPKTKAAVIAFQKSKGLTPDGVVGPKTWAALRAAGPPTPPTPQPTQPTHPTQPTKPSDGFETSAPKIGVAPRNYTEAQKYEYYARIVREAGGQVCANGQPTVLGIRGMDLDGNKHATTNNKKYDDVFVVLTADGKVRELRGATHPGQKASTASPSVTATYSARPVSRRKACSGPTPG